MSHGSRLPRAVRHALLLCRGSGSVGAAQPCTTTGSLLESWWGAAHGLPCAAEAVCSFDLLKALLKACYCSLASLSVHLCPCSCSVQQLEQSFANDFAYTKGRGAGVRALVFVKPHQTALLDCRA